jgi:hypothetical protein
VEAGDGRVVGRDPRHAGFGADVPWLVERSRTAGRRRRRGNGGRGEHK